MSMYDFYFLNVHFFSDNNRYTDCANLIKVFRNAFKIYTYMRNELNSRFDYLLLCTRNIPRAHLTDTNDVPNEYNRIKSS